MSSNEKIAANQANAQHSTAPGEIQSTLFAQLIQALWNLNIARELDAVALSQFDHKQIANAARYLGQFKRAFAKALKMLKDQQTDFALRAVPENEPIAGLPAACRLEKIAAQATRLAQQQERTHRAAILTAIAQVFAVAPQNEANPEAEYDEPALDRAA